MIFTGIEILFFLLGVLSTLLVLMLLKWNKEYSLNWKSWSILGLGSFLLVFAVAWSFSSVLEGEPRAGSMGAFVFGIPSLLLLIVGRRMISTTKK